MATNWLQFPVISGLMITTNPDRHDFALTAMNDFLAQDWVHKELIILNSTGLDFPKIGAYEIVVRRTTEDLWNFGLNQCTGEWIADWQDDCRYTPNYLRSMARVRKREAVVRLQSYEGRLLDTGETVIVDNTEKKFGLMFRFAPNVSEVFWKDSPELVTRYYASKQIQA